METATVTVNDVAHEVLGGTGSPELWDLFMSEYVPQTPEFAFVREISPNLTRDLFDAAFIRWRIRRYWSQFAGEIAGITISGGNLSRFVLDQAWIDTYCQLPDLQQWTKQLVRA